MNPFKRSKNLKVKLVTLKNHIDSTAGFLKRCSTQVNSAQQQLLRYFDLSDFVSALPLAKGMSCLQPHLLKTPALWKPRMWRQRCCSKPLKLHGDKYNQPVDHSFFFLVLQLVNPLWGANCQFSCVFLCFDKLLWENSPIREQG